MLDRHCRMSRVLDAAPVNLSCHLRGFMPALNDRAYRWVSWGAIGAIERLKLEPCGLGERICLSTKLSRSMTSL